MFMNKMLWCLKKRNGYTLHFFYRRKCMTKHIPNLSQIKSEMINDDKNEMIVFETNGNRTEEIINMILEKQKSYAPIIEMGSDTVYYFPKSTYRDAYLLKDIFATKTIEQINIYVGKNIIQS